MKIVVTGVNGQLGHDIMEELDRLGFNDVIGLDKSNLDISNQIEVARYFRSISPNIIIHCAAYTDVEQAENNQNECLMVNVLGTKNLVEQAVKHSSKFIYISTDYVFDGEKKTPYEIDDKVNPQSIYGKSKLLGELEALKHNMSFIVRTSWVFGKNGVNFIKKILKLAVDKDTISIVSDQIGSPTYTRDLSLFLIDLMKTTYYGVYHATNEETCTWYELAKEVFRLSNISIDIKPILTGEFKTKAKRPLYSVLSKKSLDSNGFNRLPPWKDAIKRYLNEIEVI